MYPTGKMDTMSKSDLQSPDGTPRKIGRGCEGNNICDFPYPISDLTEKLDTLCMT